MQALQRALPHEDIVLVCDHAYAPYPRRPPRVVLDRIGRLADELAERPVKLLLVASASATDEGLGFLQARLAPLPGARDWTRRSRQRGASTGRYRARRRRRGVSAQPAVLASDAPGARTGRDRRRRVAGAARAGRTGAGRQPRRSGARGEQLSTLGPEVTALALVCPHSAALRGLIEQALPPGAVIVDGIALAVERVRRQLAMSRLQARRLASGTVDRDVDGSQPGEWARACDAEHVEARPHAGGVRDGRGTDSGLGGPTAGSTALFRAHICVLKFQPCR